MNHTTALAVQSTAPREASHRGQICFMLLAITSATFSACADRGTPDALVEAVLASELGDQPGQFVPCVSIDGRDPGDKLLAKLQTINTTLVRGSDCVYVLDVNKGSYHVASGRKAALVDIRFDRDKGEAHFDMMHHGLWGVFRTLEVRQEGTNWKIGKVVKEALA